MKLHDIVEAYIDYKHSLGMRYRSQTAVLRAFHRAMGNIAIAEVKPDSVLFKTRLVPIGPRLTTVLTDHLSRRCQLPLLTGEASTFLATRTGCFVWTTSV
jgi:hypothetical protein